MSVCSCVSVKRSTRLSSSPNHLLVNTWEKNCRPGSFWPLQLAKPENNESFIVGNDFQAENQREGERKGDEDVAYKNDEPIHWKRNCSVG